MSPTGLTHRPLTRDGAILVDDYRCSAEVRGSFQETAPRKTAENTVKHHVGGVGLVVANHRVDGGISMTVTTLHTTLLTKNSQLYCFFLSVMLPKDLAPFSYISPQKTLFSAIKYELTIEFLSANG